MLPARYQTWDTATGARRSVLTMTLMPLGRVCSTISARTGKANAAVNPSKARSRFMVGGGNMGEGGRMIEFPG
jgi:hypothetical protein